MKILQLFRVFFNLILVFVHALFPSLIPTGEWEFISVTFKIVLGGGANLYVAHSKNLACFGHFCSIWLF